MCASILPNHVLCMAVSTSPGRPRVAQRLGMSVLDQQSQLGFDCHLGLKTLGKPTSHSFIILCSIQLLWILAGFHVQTPLCFAKLPYKHFLPVPQHRWNRWPVRKLRIGEGLHSTKPAAALQFLGRQQH